jgi:Ca2+/Na+ antiporter
VNVKIQILGWLLFIVSVVAYIAASVESGNRLELVGGVAFLLACFVFLIPLLATGEQDRRGPGR